MSLRFVIDMNLSVEWIAEFARQGWPAVHWSGIGSPTATDKEIMAWAIGNQHVVFTHDLDFGATLALTHEKGPSVIQVRGQLVLPEDIGTLVALTIRQHESELHAGALVVLELRKCRIRILPF